MVRLRALLAALRVRLRRNAVSDDIRDEMAFHLAERAEEYRRQGLTADDASRAARRRFGNAALLEDEAYDIRGATWMDGLGRDIRHGVKSLRRAPGFFAAAVGVMALAIGAAAAIYSIVDGVLLRPLPFSQPDRLVGVEGVGGRGAFLQTTRLVTPQTFLDWRRLQPVFDAIAMDEETSLRYRTSAGVTIDLQAERVTSEFFSVLRVRPRFGRLFVPADEREGQPRQVIVSSRFWRERLDAASGVVGRTLDIEDEPWTVVAVLPADFGYPLQAPRPADVFVPRTWRPGDVVRGKGRNYNATVIGRLKDGISVTRADAEMRRVVEALDRQYPDWEPGRGVRVRPLRDVIVGDARRWMRLLLATAALVLLIACANVANLILVRATVRRRDVAVRAALGATRARLARAALIEGLLLAGSASVLGGVLGTGALAMLRTWLPPGVPRAAAIGINVRVLAVEVAVAVLVGVGFGLVGARRARRGELTSHLTSSGRGVLGRSGEALRQAIVAAEVTLAMVLLTGAVVFASSFIGVMRVDLGFNQHQVLALRNIGLRFEPHGDSGSRWTWSPTLPAPDRDRRARAYFDEIRTALAHLPGVASAAIVSGGVPIQGGWSNLGVTRADGSEFSTTPLALDRIQATPNYLALLQVPVLRGRALSDQDVDSGVPAVVVNQAAAQRMWPGGDPIGQRFVLDGRERVVVGVAGDTRHLGPEEPIRPQVYVVFGGERPQPATATVVIRSTGRADALLPAVEAAIWRINPDQDFNQDVFTLEGYLANRVAVRRFNMTLMTILGVLGLVIATLGIYGVLAYVVAQRRREIALRVALGARPAAVLGLVSRRMGLAIGSGVAAGLLASRAFAGVVRAFLFDVEPTDPRVIASVVGTVALAALAACAVPVWRAISVDPVYALREE
jgi:predicted permease